MPDTAESLELPPTSAEERAVDASLATLAEEIAHELAACIPFFEGLFGSAGGIEAEDRALAVEELDRMRRIVGVLRTMKLQPLMLLSQPLSPLVEDALAPLRPWLEHRALALECRIDPALELPLERETAIRVVRLLAKHLAEVARAPGRLVIACDETQLRLGAKTEGQPEEPARTLWRAMSRRAEAVRWMLASRLARALGWQVTAKVVEESLLIELAFRRAARGPGVMHADPGTRR
jgi:hypothetical protein